MVILSLIITLQENKVSILYFNNIILLCRNAFKMKFSGANLVFDCILRALRQVYVKNLRNPITLSNLYIQLDNTNYNKGYGLLSALASLIQNGVVKKVHIFVSYMSLLYSLFKYICIFILLD